MAYGTDKGFVRIFKSKAFKFSLAIGLLITSILIILAMLLGNESGNFVVKVESGDATKSIAITDSMTDRVYTNKLVVPGMLGMTNSTPRWFLEGDTSAQQHIGIKNITKELGEHTSEEYYSYTFLIVNTSSAALTVKLHMIYSNVTNYVDQAVRVMTYDDDSEAIHIYQLADPNVKEYAYYPATPQNFGSQGTVYDEYATIPATTDPENPEYFKYSVFFWLEGQDDDCVEKIYNGTIKFALTCSVE